MFFSNWMGLLRIVVVGPLSYLALVLLLRGLGKRSLAKMNAFDWVVTVALGSALATAVLSKDVPLAESALAFTVLLGLQFAVSWLTVRSRTVEKLLKAQPRLLVYNGQMLHDEMKRERVTQSEILQTVRTTGLSDISQARAVVLETDGTIAVIQQGDDLSAMENVQGLKPGDDDSRPAAGKA